mmetsp:Transcript_4728/g.5481  ORF Transcript_4728/g.5481 Transcript_4728/m.5481 type:complete len:160 (+) Transcript_4728:272-751(+)|eukprot:CAMPEP_0197865060 /NCGR_PEP_ID=MMETSP1438-20131217/43447_1 /TAXON_ID=1461541 /ORGANISM="Pterosperma sp., Strain CCMP1384" /LENGTH=159 /DNA_ID=CAMNT_0043483469 /DNA_START=270 /DNA_END=749 /DNA_ORIENTATION=-
MPLPSQKNARAAIARKSQEENAERSRLRRKTQNFLDQAKEAHDKEDYATAIKLLQQAVDVDPEDTDSCYGSLRPYVYYSLACDYSCSGNIEAGIRWLTRAVRVGYGVGPINLRHREWARKDPDLAKLREDSRFEPTLTGKTQPKKPSKTQVFFKIFGCS